MALDEENVNVSAGLLPPDMTVTNTATVSIDAQAQLQPDAAATTTAVTAMEESKSNTNFITLPPLPRAPELLFSNTTEEKKLYWDRSHYDSPESQMRALAESSTLYIGNMAFSTRSYNVLSLFSQIGPVRKVVMGEDRFLKTPCGFGFVEYVHRNDALLAVSNLSSTKLDGRIIRVELDAGFQPGRQYGRGKSGGQVRDDKRKGQIDPKRNNKRHRTHYQNWTPPEKVVEATSTSNVGVGTTQQQQQQDVAMGEQAATSRFRDES